MKCSRPRRSFPSAIPSPTPTAPWIISGPMAQDGQTPLPRSRSPATSSRESCWKRPQTSSAVFRRCRSEATLLLPEGGPERVQDGLHEVLEHGPLTGDDHGFGGHARLQVNVAQRVQLLRISLDPRGVIVFACALVLQGVGGDARHLAVDL